MNVGIIGCGNIADIYFSNSQKYFNNFQIVACADIKNEAAKNYAEKYGLEQLSVDQILSNKEIELIINLTIPDVHFEVSKSILEAGKHSYSEKPLSIDVLSHLSEALRTLKGNPDHTEVYKAIKK